MNNKQGVATEFDETLRASLTGYATKSSLPKPPQRKAKFMADHQDDAFLRDRLRELDTYVKKLVEVPHAWLSTGAPAFVGLSDAVREYSVLFPEKTLGFTLGRTPVPAALQTALSGGQMSFAAPGKGGGKGRR